MLYTPPRPRRGRSHHLHFTPPLTTAPCSLTRERAGTSTDHTQALAPIAEPEEESDTSGSDLDDEADRLPTDYHSKAQLQTKKRSIFLSYKL